MATTHERYLVTLDAQSAGAVKGLSAFDRQVQKSEKGWEKFSRSVGVSSATLKAGLASLGGAVIGGTLAAGLQRMVTGYADAAKAAGDLAEATGSSVAQVSGMQAALQDAGVSAETSAKMLTKFTTAVSSKKGADVLDELNVQLVRGASGAADYAASMTVVVDAILATGDASQRNTQLVALFGREGARAFQDLIASGVSLADAIDAIDTGRLLDEQDVRNAAEYDEAMDGLAASGQKFGYTVGRLVVPALNDILGLAGPIVDTLSGIDSEFLLIGGAAIGLSRIIRTDLVAGALARLGTGLATAATGAAALATGAASVGTAAKGAAVGLKAMAASAGPMLLLVGAVTAASEAMQVAGERRDLLLAPENVNKSLKEQAQILHDTDSAWSSFTEWLTTPAWSEAGHESERLNTNMNRLTGSMLDQTAATVASADATESQKRAAQALIDLMGQGTREQQTQNLATDEGTRLMAEYAAAVGGMAGAQQTAALHMGDLTDLLTDGAASMQDISRAAGDAAASQEELNRVDKQAKALIKAVADASWDAVEATLARTSANLSARSASRGVAAAVSAQADAWDAIADAERKLNDIRKEGASSAELAAGERDLADARRDHAQAIDDTVAAALRAADATVDYQRALHPLMTDAEATKTQIDSLKESLKLPGMTTAAKNEIQGVIDELEKARKIETGQWKVVGDVEFDLSTDKGLASFNTAIADLQTRIARAKDYGDTALAQRLQLKLDAVLGTVTLPESTELPVTLVNADGSPLTSVDVPVTATGLDNVTQGLANLPAVAPTAIDVPVTYTVAGGSLDRINGYNEDLDGQRLTVSVNYKVWGDSLDRINRYNDNLDGKLLTVSVRYERLNSVPVGVSPEGLAARSTVFPTATTRAGGADSLTVAGGRYGGGISYAPTIVNNYPKPERASDSIAAALRIARYLGPL